MTLLEVLSVRFIESLYHTFVSMTLSPLLPSRLPGQPLDLPHHLPCLGLLMDPVTSNWCCLLCPDPMGLCSLVRAQLELGLPSPHGAAGPCCSPATKCLSNS